MAIFSKNANRAALFGKQKLFKACCTPEVEECCYSTDPTPRPVCNCEPLFSIDFDGDNYPLPYSTPLVITSLPKSIDFIFENLDSCPIEFTKLSLVLSGPINYNGFTIDIAPSNILVLGNSSLIIMNIEVDISAQDGSYEFNYSYLTTCGNAASGSISVDIATGL
jgi:hypothetical protein